MIKNEKKIREIVSKEIKNVLRESKSEYEWSLPIEQWDKFTTENAVSDLKSMLNLKSTKLTVSKDENSITMNAVLTNNRDLGPMGPVIKDLKIKIVLLCAEKNGKQIFYAFVDWKYTHPGGGSSTLR